MLANETVVEYMKPDLPVLTLERLTPEAITSELGTTTLRLLEQAYASSLEATGLLPEGSMARHVAALEPEAQATKMREAIEQGSQYWIATFDPAIGAYVDKDYQGVNGIAGLMKLSPSRSKVERLTRQNPHLYINDVLVAPQLQRRGIGSAALHVATTQAGFRNNRDVALHAYVDSAISSSQLYPELGFTEVEDSQQLATYGGHNVEQVLMSTAGRSSVGKLRDTLKLRSPWLNTQALTPKS